MMSTELAEILEKKFEISKEEKISIVNKMITKLDDNQISQVIESLKKPFFNAQLNEYLIDSQLPEIDSKEFDFLVQAAKYHGNIVRSLMNEAGISNYYIDKFSKKYHLKTITNKTLVFPSKKIDAPFLFQKQYSKSVISHESALYLLDLCDVIPKRTVMSMPMRYKLSQISDTVLRSSWEIYNRKKSLLVRYPDNDPLVLTRSEPIEKSQILIKETSEGNPVRVTTSERTIADILRPNSCTDEESKVESIRKYYYLNPGKGQRLRRVAHKEGVLSELDRYLWSLKLD
ncbi:hypothetical protein [Xylocopilactobacillus apis]|uniref:WYL domain-containing protein n=1 Tax=Xylocopilactobacillus apis TaxID=2932183 RepID=A0AAU9DGY1_9LACO|nr:hypothetical protein [Xylocopilactobacillus apis]BDR55992.1 hypothetical protein KIMC2_05540 [Xylocopilactobacillus apis]